jgi:hypothetical protein
MDSAALELLKYPIVLVGLTMAIVHIKLAIKYKGMPCAWTKWGIALMGIYWAFYYMQSIVIKGGIFSGHQVWVRSPILVTLALVTAMGILSLRRLEK